MILTTAVEYYTLLRGQVRYRLLEYSAVVYDQPVHVRSMCESKVGSLNKALYGGDVLFCVAVCTFHMICLGFVLLKHLLSWLYLGICDHYCLTRVTLCNLCSSQQSFRQETAATSWHHMWPALVNLWTCHSDKWPVLQESTMQAIFCLEAFLEAVELPFNNPGLPWMNYYKRNHTWNHNTYDDWWAYC